MLSGDRHQGSGPLSSRRDLHRPAGAVGVGHPLDALIERRGPRLAVDHERHEVLDEVAGVKVDRVLAARDDLREQVMREPLPPRSVRFAGEETVQVVPVLWIHIDAAFVEPRAIEEREDKDRPADGVRRQRSADPDRRVDPGVLRGVDPSCDEDRGTGHETRDGEVGPIVFGEALIALERERADGALAGRRDGDRTDPHTARLELLVVLFARV